MDCTELDQPVQLTYLFREKQQRELNRIFNCFRDHYFHIFMGILYKMSARHPFLNNDPDGYGNDAFNDGLLAFYQRMTDKGFEEGKAKLRTFFFSFCVFKLRAMISDRYRDQKKLGELIKNSPQEGMVDIEVEDLLNEQQTLFQKALNMLNENQRQYIIMRKIDEASNEEIAAKMGVAPGSVNNQVFVAFKALKKIIDTLNSKQ